MSAVTSGSTCTYQHPAQTNRSLAACQLSLQEDRERRPTEDSAASFEYVREENEVTEIFGTMTHPERNKSGCVCLLVMYIKIHRLFLSAAQRSTMVRNMHRDPQRVLHRAHSHDPGTLYRVSLGEGKQQFQLLFAVEHAQLLFCYSMSTISNSTQDSTMKVN